MTKKTSSKTVANNNVVNFKKGEYVVYAHHGVGQIEGTEVNQIGGSEVKLYSINFEHNRMRVKVPVTSAQNSGLRKLSTKDRLEEAMTTLKGRARTRRTMWSRRAAEYETKINSGDPVAIAEVLRDLKRSNDDEKSYSERQIYQAALERLAREVAIVDKLTEDQAAEKLEVIMNGKKKKPANDEKVAA